ncbi:MAG: DJ-1/PfpI family protein [Candidatus Methanomethylophilaceae archaeon]
MSGSDGRVSDVYLYVQDTMADWEIGHLAAELASGRFFGEDAPVIRFRTVGETGEPVRTMGGLTVIPDITVSDITVSEDAVVILPGSDRWQVLSSSPIMDTAEAVLSAGGTVCAICGATVALAERGMLDSVRHTSNGPGFLGMFSSGYRGESLYVDEPAVSDGGVITAGSHGSLMWAKLILGHLGVFDEDVLDAWYGYFSTGDPQCYFRMVEFTNRG